MKVSQPFEFSATRRIGYISGVILLAIAFAAGMAGLLYSQGHFQLPEQFSIIPFEALCGGITLIFFVFGLSEMFRFRGYRVNPSRQTIQMITKGIFGTRYGEEILFNELSYVHLNREENRNIKDNHEHFYFSATISLKSGDAKRVFSGDYLSARVCAEKLAKSANIDLHDDSVSGASQIRKPEELDKTVHEKLRERFSLRTSPSKPLRMHTTTQLSFDALIIENPRFDVNNLGALKKGLWMFFAIFGILTVISLYFEEYMLAIFGTFIVGVMFIAVLRSETITLTQNTLSVRSGVGIFKRTQQIPLSELEELYLSNVTKSEKDESDKLHDKGYISGAMQTLLESIIALGSSIVARSDHKSIVFGRILSHDELDHILYQMERWIR